MQHISAVIITYNEEKNIERCLLSLQGVADEIVVVDSFSSDRTEEICKGLGVVFIQRKWDNYSMQKNFGNNSASYDYILSIDADEVLSEKLKEAILSEKDTQFTYDAYDFNRLTFFYGKAIKHCGWYPDKKVRLWNRLKAQWEGDVHEKLVFGQGTSVKHLSGDLLHYTADSFFFQVEKINKYSDAYANAAVAAGKKVSLLKIIFKPGFKFFHIYILKLGILDGLEGFLISCLSALDSFLRLSKIKINTKKSASK